MTKRQARVMYKALKLINITTEQCLADEHFFAQGKQGTKWVAWIMMLPDHQIVTDRGPIAELNEEQLDHLLSMTWHAAKPISALEVLARHVAID